jgi:hypothetical protein
MCHLRTNGNGQTATSAIQQHGFVENAVIADVNVVACSDFAAH